jgi:hypothetical protein
MCVSLNNIHAAGEQLNDITEQLEEELTRLDQQSVRFECNKETFDECIKDTFKYIREQKEQFFQMVTYRVTIASFV